MASASDMQGKDDESRIIFHTDYIECAGIHYLESVVSFTKSSVEAKTRSRDGEKRRFYTHMDIGDIEKIESQWSARCGDGMIHMYFISYSAREDDTSVKDSGIKEFKFPFADTNWHEKFEAIKTLNVRYDALWNDVLDNGLEMSSPSPEGKQMPQRRSYFPEFDKPFGILTYPENGPDRVMIRKADVDRLLPDTFFNSPLLDFYIKYLECKLTVEQKAKFHFFDPYFFQRLANIDGDPSSALDGMAAFERVRCYRSLNLLEKDFIFVPVCYSSHWSLIVICYFGEAAVCEDAAGEEVSRVPCILHMNSVRGTHRELKHLMQSYLLEELKERTKETCQKMTPNFRKLKFVSLKLPQQQNGSDCGLFVLHYLERFLEEVPPYFNIHKLPSFSKFLQPDWFPPNEASLKRAHIARLIKGLLDNRPKDSYERDISSDADDFDSSDCPVKVVQIIKVSDDDSSESHNDAQLPSSSKRKTSRSKIFEEDPVSLTESKKRKSSSVPLRTNDEFSSEQIETTPPPSVSERRDDLEKESGAATRRSKEHQMGCNDDHSAQPRRSSRVPKRNPKYFDDRYIL